MAAVETHNCMAIFADAGVSKNLIKRLPFGFLR